jgi:DNA ligase-1
MQQLAEICEAVAATTKKTEKVHLVAGYFRSNPFDAPRAAVFLSGRAFPSWEERTLQVGGAMLWRAVAEISGKGEVALTAAYRKYGDMGSAAAEILSSVAQKKHSLSLSDLQEVFDKLALTPGAEAKSRMLQDLLRSATALETKYIVKIIGGDLRIGLRESLVEEAIAEAFDEKLAAVQRANMLLGDISETLRLAAAHRLPEARLRLFHPLGFMLASPVENAEEALSYFPGPAVEDKYDGVRAQAHCGGKDNPRVRIFSRTRDEIGESFPELPPALLAFPDALILDGEILAWDGVRQRALAFSDLQKRLGRKEVSEDLVREVPVVYMVFDVLYAAGELTIDRPLADRREILEKAMASAPEGGLSVSPASATAKAQGHLGFESPPDAGQVRVILSRLLSAESPQQLDQAFLSARQRGNEGLMVKDLDSPYTPGRRGKAWLKLKRELATLDVVVTAVEWGHGKRAHVLSDYTFAVRDGARLLNVGKAYSGLTDVEIAQMTDWFREHTLEDQGFRRAVEPRIVVEVAFNNVTRSDRHESGFALRFPRIVRIRTDKSSEEIDTLDTVREIYEKQGMSSQRRRTENDS